MRARSSASSPAFPGTLRPSARGRRPSPAPTSRSSRTGGGAPDPDRCTQCTRPRRRHPGRLPTSSRGPGGLSTARTRLRWRGSLRGPQRRGLVRAKASDAAPFESLAAASVCSVCVRARVGLSARTQCRVPAICLCAATAGAGGEGHVAPSWGEAMWCAAVLRPRRRAASSRCACVSGSCRL